MNTNQARNPRGRVPVRVWASPVRLNRAALILLFSLPALVAADPLPDKPHIYVQGDARIEVEPDRLTISVGLTEVSDKLETAKGEVDARSRLLIERARAIGIEDRDIGTTSLRITPTYDYVDGERVDLGTAAYREVTLTLRDLSQYSELMSALVEADISTWISTRFLVSNGGALTDEALTRALENARARAERLAESQGKRLGDVYSISEFNTRRDESYQLYPSRRIVGQSSSAFTDAQVSDNYVSEPFEPGMMVATATVYVVYLIR
jgi:uncharacterized protein YggE